MFLEFLSNLTVQTCCKQSCVEIEICVLFTYIRRLLHKACQAVPSGWGGGGDEIKNLDPLPFQETKEFFRKILGMGGGRPQKFFQTLGLHNNGGLKLVLKTFLDQFSNTFRFPGPPLRNLGPLFYFSFGGGGGG